MFELFGVLVGAQTRIMAVRFGKDVKETDDRVMIVGRALRHFCPLCQLKDFKICLDEGDGLVYLLAHDDVFVPLHRGWKVSVGSEYFGFADVKSLALMEGSDSEYFNIPVRIKVCVFLLLISVVSNVYMMCSLF